MAAALQPAFTTRTGCDLVRVDAIAESLAAFGTRYLARIYTPRELGDCGGASPSIPQLAARFAAKEAALKVLRPVRHWFDWREIEVLRADGGWVDLFLHGRAAAQASAQGLCGFSVSLSHEHDLAMAVVVATLPVCDH